MSTIMTVSQTDATRLFVEKVGILVLAYDVFSTAHDEVVICSSSPPPDPCTPSSFGPISSSLKLAGVQSSLLESLS